MSTIIYPKCNKSLKLWLNSNKKFQYIFNQIGNPRIFDVSLRDGLQSIIGEEQKKFTTEYKMLLYQSIVDKYNPSGIEVGSLVSPKVLPILSDSIEVFKQTNLINNLNYLLVPNSLKLKDAINIECNNISLISSVSESFQLKNTKKTIKETKSDIVELMYEFYSVCKIRKPNTKLYLSCIDHCPIEGRISNDKIISEIMYYHKICKPDIICLSDTCGNLKHENFIKIVDEVNKKGVNYDKLSLHLHINTENLINAQKIFYSALDRKICEFDVSLLETGGCSITIDSKKTKPNLSYDLYYKFLVDYILLRSEGL